MATESMVRRCDVPGTTLSVIIEDDDRVAYAYLSDGGQITSDVWLYNVAPAPDKVDWRDESQMPFLNPKPFCKEESLARITEQSDVVCAVSTDCVEVKLGGRVIARLKAGARPGWSILAGRKGPLAQPLV
jgi:hypothetical protein